MLDEDALSSNIFQIELKNPRAAALCFNNWRKRATAIWKTFLEAASSTDNIRAPDAWAQEDSDSVHVMPGVHCAGVLFR